MTRHRLPTSAQIRAMPCTSVRDLRQALKNAGLLVQQGKTHLRVTTRSGTTVGTLPLTPSDSRTLLNCRADIAKRVAEVKHHGRDNRRTSDLPTGSR